MTSLDIQYRALLQAVEEVGGTLHTARRAEPLAGVILRRAAEIAAALSPSQDVVTSQATEVETLRAEVNRLNLLLRNCNTARHAAVARWEAAEAKAKPYDPDDPRGLGHPSSY